jgi:hypothetical protein
MTVYYYVNSMTGELVSNNGEVPLDPIPEGQTEVTVAPPDERMYWDFAGNWYWTTEGLIMVAQETRNTALAQDVDVFGDMVSPGLIPIFEWSNLADIARGEDPEATRILVLVNGDRYEVSNADLVEFMAVLWNEYQKINDVYEVIVDQINAETIEDLTDLATAWASAFSGYSTVRDPLPTLSELDDRIEVLEANFETKSAYIDSISLTSVTILGITIPNLAWGSGVTSAINNMRDCLVEHNLMEAA